MNVWLFVCSLMERCFLATSLSCSVEPLHAWASGPTRDLTRHVARKAGAAALHTAVSSYALSVRVRNAWHAESVSECMRECVLHITCYGSSGIVQRAQFTAYISRVTHHMFR